MNQVVIDPNNRRTTVERPKLIAQLPPDARRFGFVLDLSLCKAGDLILSSSLKPDLIERQIFKAQESAGFATEHSRWTHAAVFLYRDFVAEAVPKEGVHTRSFYEDIPGSRFRIRRRRDLDDSERYEIALCAQRMLGMRYDLKAALSFGWQAKFSKMWNRHWRKSQRKDSAICSQVFYDAYAEITRNRLIDCPLVDVMPAHLSATPDLDDVDVPWLKLM